MTDGRNPGRTERGAVTPEDVLFLGNDLLGIMAPRHALGNALALCHCGSGRKREW
jgi:hypothetical protein